LQLTQELFLTANGKDGLALFEKKARPALRLT
jgi:hypothetical protein